MVGTYIDGLREAKKIVRAVRALVKGETDSYAKGFRVALIYVERNIDKTIEEIKKAQTTS